MELVNSEKSILQEKKKLALFIIAGLMIIGVYQIYLKEKVKTEGVYVKAEVVASKRYKGGVMTTVNYRYKGHTYTGRVNSPRGKENVGAKYFLKLLPNDPEVSTLLVDYPVPECLLNVDQPFVGWKDMPTCKNQ